LVKQDIAYRDDRLLYRHAPERLLLVLARHLSAEQSPMTTEEEHARPLKP
jgi:hypothetical protein